MISSLQINKEDQLLFSLDFLLFCQESIKFLYSFKLIWQDHLWKGNKYCKKYKA
jgi:hypothetical protein